MNKERAKKSIAYCIGILILLVPLVSIVVVSIVTMPNLSYSDDLSGESEVDTEEAHIGAIEETITVNGIFDSSVIVENRIKSKSSEPVILVEEGDYVETGECIAEANGKKIYSAAAGVVSTIKENGVNVSIFIKSNDVDRIAVKVPAKYYDAIGKSTYVGTSEVKKIKGNFIKADQASSDGLSFNAYYTVPEGDYLLNSQVEVKLKTGLKKKKIIILNRKCLFLSSGGGYYVELYNDEEITKVPVKIGIVGDREVEVIATKGEKQISKGQLFVKNDKDVLSENNESTNAEVGTDESTDNEESKNIENDK